MERGVTFFDRNENAATSCADFSAGGQRPLDRRTIIRKIDNFRGQMHGTICRGGSKKLNRIFRRDRAWCGIGIRALHQMIGPGPVAVAIKQRADDPAIQNPGERFVFFLRRPFGDNFVALGKTPDVQPVRIGRSTTEAGVLGRVFFLERLFRHGACPRRTDLRAV